MLTTSAIREIIPTAFLRRGARGLEQLLRVTIDNAGGPAPALLALSDAGGTQQHHLSDLPAGESTHDIFISEPLAPAAVQIALEVDGQVVDRQEMPLTPPRHWQVHIIQLSHHDIGYTDLGSRVFLQHDRALDEAIDFATATRDYPDEAQFRIQVEQAWSIEHYLRHARPARAEEMVRLLRSGHVEPAALFGNMTTELCGHETMARALYPAFRLRREYGIPLISAEHNDVPGVSWGLAQALTEAGVKMLFANLPTYYTWGDEGIPSFWDDRALFGYEDAPAIFWWQAPSGKRVLFWSANSTFGGADPALPELEATLRRTEERGYPYEAIRMAVSGAPRDNAPYSGGYAGAILAWNRAWAFPHLISSTNGRFYADITPRLPDDIPVLRGEVPGQDYPIGAASTALATAANRANHALLPAAEALSTSVWALGGLPSQAALLGEAYEETLQHDEHTWGVSFPCGAAARTAEMEKALHAQRGGALGERALADSLSPFTTQIHRETDDRHLAVFNSLPVPRNGLVSVFLRGVEELDGPFRLIDLTTGRPVPCQITEISSPLGPDPFAAQRIGKAAGGKHLGLFGTSHGLKCCLQFIAEDVPPLGYTTYRLAPGQDGPPPAYAVQVTSHSLENEFYRIEVDRERGTIQRLFDKTLGREFVEATARHPFGSLVVSGPHQEESLAHCEGVNASITGPFTGSLCIRLAAPGHPQIEMTLTLYAGVRRVDVACHVLKDPTPLLEMHLAFPFLLPDGRFRYEGTLCVLDPTADLITGAYANRLVVQNWLKAASPDASVVWTSQDAPNVSLGQLWPTRTSQAHACIPAPELRDPPQTAADLAGGQIYSCLFANNFGTNFSNSQTGAVLFRYAFTTLAGDASDEDAAVFGWEQAAPLQAVFTPMQAGGTLPMRGHLLEVAPSSVHLLALKHAEDGRGLIARLWNPGKEAVKAVLRMPGLSIREVVITNLVEEDTTETVPCSEHLLTVPLPAGSVTTLRLIIE